MFAEEFLPVYDVSDEVATVVAADPHAVWQALLEAELIEVGQRPRLARVTGAPHGPGVRQVDRSR